MGLFGRETQEDKARAESYARWLRSQNVLAIASLVLGIFSFIEFGVLWIFGVGGIATGILALRQLKNVDPHIRDAPIAPEPSRARVDAVAYADSEVAPPVHALDYDLPASRIPR